MFHPVPPMDVLHCALHQQQPNDNHFDGRAFVEGDRYLRAVPANEAIDMALFENAAINLGHLTKLPVGSYPSSLAARPNLRSASL
jgi:hypothetical protein